MIPILLFKSKMPDKIPESMQKEVDKLKKCKSKMDCLKKAYNIITTRYHGSTPQLILNYYDFLTTDVDKLWKRQGYLHCHYQNYLLRVLLVKSGFFKDEDILLKFTVTYGLSPHAYLKINAGDKFVFADPWFHYRGLPLGDHARGFHVRNCQSRNI